MLPTDAFEKMKELIRKHPTAEIEIRLGKRTTKMFDSNVGHDTFTKIVKGLEKYNGWESVTNTDESVYIKDDGYRIIIDNETDEAIHQMKKKVCSFDKTLEGPLDIRLSIAYETQCEDRGVEMDFEIRRVRKSFLRKGVRIDCTKRSGPPKDRDAESLTEYQVEVELVEVPEKDSDLYNSLHKAMNVIDMVS